MKVVYYNPKLTIAHIAEALVIAGLPKSTTLDNLDNDIQLLESQLDLENKDRLLTAVLEPIKRARALGGAKTGSGHDCFLKGCIVTAVVTAPAYQWPQIQRYHFLDIVSSQSKMHKITKMNIKAQCNEEVDDEIISIVNAYIGQYNECMEYLESIMTWKADTPANALEKHDAMKAEQQKADHLFRKIINNVPQGLHLAAGIVTNYLQLKTMEQQRDGHKLIEWTVDFKELLDLLPYYRLLTGRRPSYLGTTTGRINTDV